MTKHEVGFRIQVTAANTNEEMDRQCEVLTELAERFQLQPHREPVPAVPGGPSKA